MKMFKEGMLHPLLQQIFEMVSLSMNTIALSTTVCCMPDEIALRHYDSCSFRLKKKLFWSGLLLSFCCKLSAVR